MFATYRIAFNLGNLQAPSQLQFTLPQNTLLLDTDSARWSNWVKSWRISINHLLVPPLKQPFEMILIAGRKSPTTDRGYYFKQLALYRKLRR